MTRLKWGSAGERFFETGVDQGVLYLPAQPGVAWNGLVAVSENLTGGDATGYYVDGVKYANVAANEEFEATIVALSSPPEFAVCDGISQIHNGLFATQQPRKPFSFSYRTLVGNDVDGQEHGYKIHLVYNALAAPSNKTSGSVNSQAVPSGYSWDITTLPPAITGYKRTAHLVVDSRYSDSEVLSDVEDLLYGTSMTAPAIPTPDDLIAMFA